ncbi:MULE domain-containing protein [Trichonephila clavipes]|nr:MULE domain-containing protein [Trichonephila clavipes]
MECDDNHEGLPVAICYSNRVCSFILEPFFEEIRNRLTHLQPKVFMSDDDAAFWNAWQRVFGDVKYNMLCSWHVSRSWNKNLSSKVKDPELRKEMKNKLITLVSEIDESTFERIYDDFVQNYTKNEESKDFVEYFVKNYGGSPSVTCFNCKNSSLVRTAKIKKQIQPGICLLNPPMYRISIQRFHTEASSPYSVVRDAVDFDVPLLLRNSVAFLYSAA